MRLYGHELSALEDPALSRHHRRDPRLLSRATACRQASALASVDVKFGRCVTRQAYRCDDAA